MTFFIRYETFGKVFEVVRQIKPPILFLASDGPRPNVLTDNYRVDRCRAIAENIDWECEVHRLYSNTNIGLLSNVMDGLQFAFSRVDRLIFLEDDILPAFSFFDYCSDLLEKYKEDKRIHMICGMNHVGVYSYPEADYFFSIRGSIWGFALWKRTFDSFDTKLSFLKDDYALSLLKVGRKRYIHRKILAKAKEESLSISVTNKQSDNFELLSGLAMHLTNSMLIVPSKNMISCLGISEHSAHSPKNPKRLSPKIRNLFNMETFEVEFPLRHPKYFAVDHGYDSLVDKIKGTNTIMKFLRKLESGLRKMLYK